MHKYRADIDGLRSIAIITVLFFHAKFTGFSGGFIGVDIFFVISGYLITSLLTREFQKNGRINLWDFYAKRFKRLYPALLFTIIVTTIAYGFLFLGSTEDIKLYVRSIHYAILGIANFFFMDRVGGYFDPLSDDMPLLHFWSLSIEEQFYLIWPLVIMSINFVWPKSFRDPKTINFRIIVNLLIISIISFFIAEYWIISGSSQKAFYMMPARAWELGIGGLISLNEPRVRSFIQRLSSPVLALIGTIALFLILVPTYLFTQETNFPGHNAIYPVIATALLIVLGMNENSPFSRILSNKIFVKIGVLSYGWYLWHWPLLSFLHIYFMGETAPILLRLFALLASLGLAQFSLTFIEEPIRFGKKVNSFVSKRIVLSTIVISLLVINGAKLLNVINRNYYRTLQGENFRQELSKRAVYMNSCLKNLKSIIDCETKRNSQRRIILWGDSHAGSLSPMIEEFTKKKNVDSLILSNGGLLPLFEINGRYITKDLSFDSYNNANTYFFDYLKKTTAQETSVVIAARWNLYSGNEPISVVDERSLLIPRYNKKENLDIFYKHVELTIKELRKLQIKKVLIVLQFPEFKYPTNRCSLKTIEGCPVSRELIEDYSYETSRIFYKIAQHYPFVRIVNPLSSFCNEILCPQIIKEGEQYFPVVYDDDHPSVWASLQLEKKIEKDLNWLLN